MRRLFLKGKVWTVIVTLSVVMQASGQALIVNSNELPVDRQQYEHPKQIPLTDFFRNPSKTSFKISPDGLNIAFLTPHEGRMNVAIRSTDGSDERIMTNFTDRDVDSFEWGNDNTIICLKDNGGDKNFVLYVIDVQGKYIAITPAGSHTMIVDLLQHDDEHILFQSNLNNAEVFDLYKLNLSKKNFELFMENPGNITNWFVDSKGLPRLASATDGVGTTLMKFDGNSKWTPILTTSYRESVIPLFFDSDNKNVFCSSNVGRDKRAIVSFDIELGKETEIIYEHPEVDVNVLHQWQTKEFAGAGRMGEPLGVVEYETDKLNRHFFEDALVGLYANISAKLPDNYLFKVVSKDKQEKNLIIHAYSDKSPGAYYLYKVESVELL